MPFDPTLPAPLSSHQPPVIKCSSLVAAAAVVSRSNVIGQALLCTMQSLNRIPEQSVTAIAAPDALVAPSNRHFSNQLTVGKSPTAFFLISKCLKLFRNRHCSKVRPYPDPIIVIAGTEIPVQLMMVICSNRD